MDFRDFGMWALGVKDAKDAAHRETAESGLPEPAAGPADAYRHMIISGELARRFGPDIGGALANLYEERTPNNDPAEAAMDHHNNAVGVEIGKNAESWEDVVRGARAAMIEAASTGGDGSGATAQWIKQPTEDGWMPPDLEDRPISPIGPGAPVAPAGSLLELEGWPRVEQPADDDPMQRSVDTWSDADVTRVMNSPAYWKSGHPQRAETNGKVRQWFVHFYGDKPAKLDVAGRAIRSGPVRPIPQHGGPVQVRAYARGETQVRAHSRGAPS